MARQLLTPQERHERRLKTYAKYNASPKGIARTERWKKAHPEARWEPARNINRDIKGC
jgi:hypothetical protein